MANHLLAHRMAISVTATVALVYRTGGDYFPEYVRRIAKSARQFGARDIVCLSDTHVVGQWCDHIPLATDWPGWWSKLELFRMLSGPTVYFDLDTVIRRDIRPILRYPHEFTMLRGFTMGRGASGVMAWRGDWSHVARDFCPSRIPEYSVKGGKWGDQDWINDHLGREPEYFQDRWPGMIASRKFGTIRDRMRAAVVCYSGKPRPHARGWLP